MQQPPLAGTRVLEVGNYMAGPFCGMQLADLGADVIKVEDPRGGDLSRRLEPIVDGESGNFVRLNRGKRSIALDLKSPEGTEAFRRLASHADVIVENLRPGTMGDLGLAPRDAGSAHKLVGPYQAVRAADGHFVIGATTPPNWTAFCRALGLDRLVSDPRFADATARREHADALIPLIEEVTATRPAEHWLAVLRDAGVPCGAIQDYGRVFNDAHLEAREFFVDLEHPTLGRLRAFGTPLRFESSRARIERAGPRLGEHTREILAEAGYDQREIDRLLASRVASEPEAAPA